MQAALRNAAVDAVRGASTTLALWASPLAVCPDCQPVLNCGEPPRCPDCVCQGAARACEACPAVGASCHHFWYFILGCLTGLFVAAIGAVCLAVSRRVIAPKTEIITPALPNTAELARSQLEVIASRRRNVSSR